MTPNSQRRVSGRLVILHGGEPSGAAVRLQALSDCMGVQSFLIRLAGCDQSDLCDDDAYLLDGSSIAAGCAEDEWKLAVCRLRESGNYCMLLAIGDGRIQSSLVSYMSGETLKGIVSAKDERTIQFPKESSHLSRELAGHSFRRGDFPMLALNPGADSEFDSVMETGDGRPCFARLRGDSRRIFVWLATDVFDVKRSLAAELEFEEAVDQYVPAIVFLRTAFGDRCWHSPWIGADLIIDDPLLKRNYGFINFPDLLSLARRKAFHITVAFIPWNERRTKIQDALALSKFSDAFGICAHGCDHTRSEYKSSAYLDLLRRSHLAGLRMDSHQQRTGIPWDRYMVFPREDYSEEGLKAVADCGHFCGAFCTSCIPRELPEPRVTGADLLSPAQDLFNGFPVFKRHYWSETSPFAMASFLGKSVILVEHHEFFRRSGDQIAEVVQSINEACSGIRWASLGEIGSRTHQRRVIEPGHVDIRLFTDQSLLPPSSAGSRSTTFLRRLPEGLEVARILANGLEVPFERDREFLRFTIEGPIEKDLSIRLERIPKEFNGAPAPGWRYQLSVAVRRYLSELRDNRISKCPRFSSAVGRLTEVFRRT